MITLMASEGHPGAKLQEELDLLRRPKYSCFFRRLHRRRRSRCVVCLQVHQVTGLPLSMDGRALAVGWRARGRKGELTLPAHVRGGGAAFGEIFQHCRDAVDAGSPTLREEDFTVWVALVDDVAGDEYCDDLGTFDVVVPGRLIPAGSSGVTVSFDLCGLAKGGVLEVSVYFRVIEGQIYELIQKQHRFDPDGDDDRKQLEGARCGCFPRLPEAVIRRPRRTRSSPTVSARRMPSLNSDTAGYTTIQNVLDHNPYTTDDDDEDADEDEGFITIEKGMVRRRARSRRPPSSNSFDMALPDDDGGAEPLFRELANDEYDLDKVEDEFLKMLEEKVPEKQGLRGGAGGEFEEEAEGSQSLNLSFDVENQDLMESLVRAAEMEVNRAAARVLWKGRRAGAGGAALEVEEHEELMKRWRGGADRDHAAPPSKSSSSPTGGPGFGSPI